MNLADAPVSAASQTLHEAERTRWRTRLDMLERGDVADALAHAGAVADLTRVVAGQLGASNRGQDFAEPAIAREHWQPVALMGGLESAAGMLNDKLAGMLQPVGAKT